MIKYEDANDCCVVLGSLLCRSFLNVAKIKRISYVLIPIIKIHIQFSKCLKVNKKYEDIIIITTERKRVLLYISKI